MAKKCVWSPRSLEHFILKIKKLNFEVAKLLEKKMYMLVMRSIVLPAT
jgi:hypothetical protein